MEISDIILGKFGIENSIYLMLKSRIQTAQKHRDQKKATHCISDRIMMVYCRCVEFKSNDETAFLIRQDDTEQRSEDRSNIYIYIYTTKTVKKNISKKYKTYL